MFFFLIKGSCSDLPSSPYGDSQLFQYETNIQLYEGYNYNLGFMLELKFQIPTVNFAGFEIKIADYNSQTLNCIQILSLDQNQNLNNYTFVIKDPTRYESIDKNKFIFYFGKISFNLLTRVNNELFSETITPFIDIGIKSQNESANIKNYKFGKLLVLFFNPVLN
jgi:hypothetical protein